MRIPGSDKKGRNTKSFLAADDASRLTDEASALLDSAVGVEWYERAGNEVDFAASALCRLRRARAGEKGGPLHGDEAVRAALVRANPEALVWLASRAISYMDETGFPEAVEPWFTETEEA
jgi:hypothetical protein